MYKILEPIQNGPHTKPKVHILILTKRELNQKGPEDSQTGSEAAAEKSSPCKSQFTLSPPPKKRFIIIFLFNEDDDDASYDQS